MKDEMSEWIEYKSVNRFEFHFVWIGIYELLVLPGFDA